MICFTRTAFGLLTMAALVAVEPSWALAEVNLLVPRVAKEDIFVREFISDDDLAKGGIRIAIRTAESSSAVLQAVLKGQADLALFNLEAFNAIQPENTATLSRLLLQPFQFRNSQELFDVEDTVFGLAVLAQINKTNIFPLSFWNQGLSRIIAQPEVRT